MTGNRKRKLNKYAQLLGNEENSDTHSLEHIYFSVFCICLSIEFISFVAIGCNAFVDFFLIYFINV